MTNQLQDAVLNAIDTLVNNRIDKMEVDKTVTATVVQCTNSITGEYLCSYNGGSLYAYALENASYSTGSTVYVLVPLGDFSKRKTIVSRAQAIENDSNISFVSSALSNYNLIGKNPVADKNNNLPAKMRSYLKNNYILLYDVDNPDSSLLSFDNDEFSNSLKQAEAVLIEASFKTRLDNAHRIGKRGYYGLQFVLAFADKDQLDADGNPTVKEYAYVIDTNNMNGNPFLFLNWSEQYSIFSIDVENFLYVKSIMAFCNDFVDADNLIQADFWGDDVFVKDIEIYGLKTISATNGDYKMTLSTPEGITFKSVLPTDHRSVIGQLKKVNDILSDQAMWYWFAEDTRVVAGTDGYQMYGGSGWRYLKDKGNSYSFITYANENKAYENKYMCVCVYKETMVLKETFAINNDSVKRDLTITSNMGVKFSFDRGTPTLTCLVDGKESGFEADKENGRPDKWFNFVWSRIDKGTVISYQYTKEQLQKQIEELQRQYDEGVITGIGYQALQSIKNQQNILKNQINTQLVGATYEPGSNKFTYEVRQIDSSATFRCTVYVRDTAESEEYNIGTAEIILQNADSAAPNSYYIIIENGNQVFQYSESGVSPADKRNVDPLKVKPLTCHFYDPAGIEVNESTYQVKWQVPLESTMIVTPSNESMSINPVTKLQEWCVSEIYPLEIAENYNYQALNNQVKAIVTYYGEEYTGQTNFLFTKIGENGTNGTDIVAKIYPTSDSTILSTDCLALEIQDNDGSYSYSWNTGQSIYDQVLNFALYQRNEEVLVDSVTWSVSGGSKDKGAKNSKYLGVVGGVIDWQTEGAESRKFRNQIVRATTRIDNIDYYAFYPIPVIHYHQDAVGIVKRYSVHLDALKTLKSITYNADGHNPLYNKNQGVFVSLGDSATDDLKSKYIVWRAEGGMPSQPSHVIYNDNPTNPAFKLTYEKNSSKGVIELLPKESELLTELYILPNDVYDGAYANNLVHGMIYSSKTSYDNGNNPEVDIYIPIYMSLNTYGLKSLNSWDGNHLEINEDENYILAPQIGAGLKNDDNTFTGVVMGTAQTYDQKNPNVGLLGYSHGKQSIFLNAEEGSAVFGLPEDQASTNNLYTEGRIELNPGGDSKIGMWTIGSRAIYNMTKPPVPTDKTDDEGNIIFNKDNYEKVNPDPPYRNYPVNDAQISVPSDSQGIILNANPAYISVKGLPLDHNNSKIKWGDANTMLQEGDSLEVEIDPRKSSVFSIYRHTESNNSTPTDKKYRRYPLVGINANGQFYSNAIENGESSMGIGVIGAFKDSAAEQRYAGAQFAYKGTNLFKFFVDIKDTAIDQNKKLYISAGTTVDETLPNGSKRIGNEYPREIGIYGKSLTLYAPDIGATNEPTSSHRISISTKEAFFGHNSSYFKIDKGNIGELNLDSQLKIETPKNKPINITTGQFNLDTSDSELVDSDSELVDSDIKIKSKRNINNISGRDFIIEATKDLSIKTSVFTVESTSTTSPKSFSIVDKEGYVHLKLNSLVNRSELYSESGLNIKGGTGGITMEASSADGIKINAKPANESDTQGAYLSLIPQDGGGSDFILSSPHGNLRSGYMSSIGNVIQIPGPIINDNGLIISGTLPNDKYGSISAYKDIRSTNGWIYGGDFRFNSFGWNNWGALSEDTQSLTYILVKMWEKIDDLQNQIDTINKTMSELQNQVNNKADRNHNHDGRYASANIGLIIGDSAYVSNVRSDANNVQLKYTITMSNIYDYS